MEEEKKEFIEELDELEPTPFRDIIEPQTLTKNIDPIPLPETFETKEPEPIEEILEKEPAIEEKPVEPEIETLEEEPTSVEEKPKKKGNPYIPIIVVLFAIILCLIGYILLFKKPTDFNKKEENTTPQVKPDTPVEVDEESVKEYLMNIESYMSAIANYFPTEVKDIPSKEVVNITIRRMNNWKVEGTEFSKESIDNELFKVFGKDYTYTPESIDCGFGDGILFRYDAEKNIYIREGSHGHGADKGSLRLKLSFQEASQTSDTLTIKTKILYGGWCADTCGTPMNYTKEAKKDAEVIYKNEDSCYNTSSCEDIDIVFPKVQEELPITTFIFTKQSDGNFGLTKITVE